MMSIVGISVLGAVGIVVVFAMSFVPIALLFWVPFSGNFYSCYEAKFVGSAQHNMMVTDVTSGKQRVPHTYGSPFWIGKILSWKPNDELTVCNSMVSNRSRNDSVPCGDFGCLAVWP
jgi:hypothetical protein